MRKMIRAACNAGLCLLALGDALPAGDAPWSARMADSEMRRNPDPLLLDTNDGPRWEYTQGLVLKAILEVAEGTSDERYWKYVRAYYEGMIDPAGTIRTYVLEDYNIDRINPGKPLFRLYEKTRDERYRKAIEQLRRQLREHPRTSEGGFWHKKRYPSQMWLDGLYMGAPFLAEYAAVFGEPAALDDVITQFVLMEKHARDEKTGLLYHGWDESRKQRWADPKTGRSPSFWGRAMGWYAMGLVETLDFVPKEHPRRGELVAILGRLAAAVVRVQDPKSGVWYQVVDQGGREGNYLEASASAMFCFALLKGSRLGYLDAPYAEAGRRAYAGILKEFVETDGAGVVTIHRVCQVAGLGGDPERERYRDGTYDYYVHEKIRDNDPKAVGPFIFASLEMEAPGKPAGAASKPRAWPECADDPPGGFASPETIRIADTVVLYQRKVGGWPKNVDMARPLDGDERTRILAERVLEDATIDNGATYTQLRFLARVFTATALERFREPFLGGVDFLLRAQHPSGGWPQFFPLRTDYSRHVTFNDGAMIGVMRLLRDVAAGAEPFAFVDAARRAESARAIEGGLGLLIRAQVRARGVLTAWCAQHDEKTLEPRGARSYEVASLSGKESVGIVEYLMELPDPGEDVVRSVESAVAWLRAVRLDGLRAERVEAPDGPDVWVRPDPGAPPLWARFYEIGSNRPVFVGRDGVVHGALAEIERERRAGYGWLGPYARDLLERRYPAWRSRLEVASRPAAGP